jgi:hypothetical protein
MHSNRTQRSTLDFEFREEPWEEGVKRIKMYIVDTADGDEVHLSTIMVDKPQKMAYMFLETNQIVDAYTLRVMADKMESIEKELC